VTTAMPFEKIDPYDAVSQVTQTHVSISVSVVVKTQYYGDLWPDFLFVFQWFVVNSLQQNMLVFRPYFYSLTGQQ
jgi:hypothetical protein